jgi:hypothetical protein
VFFHHETHESHKKEFRLDEEAIVERAARLLGCARSGPRSICSAAGAA